jgi:major membrane immunogen (membrane-anchored lipoprotein)
MKAHIYTLILVSILILGGCKKEDFRYENDFDRSFARWVSFKEKTGNTYSYVVSNSSWVGTSWKTEITVTQGRVTQRSFKITFPQGLNNLPVESKEWVEKETELNSHSGGAEPVTFDQVYEKAKTDWLVKRKNVTTYFEAKNNGLLSSCGYVVDNCQDDCFVGISVTSIKP